MIFISHSARERDLAAALVMQLNADGHEAVHPDELTAQAEYPQQISAALRSADLVVGLLTGINPNVYYELGLAAAAGIPMLIVANSGEWLPTYLTNVPFVGLSGETLRDVQEIGWRVGDFAGLSSSKPETFATAEAALTAASQDTRILEALSALEFERLVAQLYRERGYHVSMTPQTRDSGVDIIVRSPQGDLTILVEVKKFSKQSRVSVEAVRHLLSIVSARNDATKGLLVTTSNFTDAALALGESGPVTLKTLEQFLTVTKLTSVDW